MAENFGGVPLTATVTVTVLGAADARDIFDAVPSTFRFVPDAAP